MNNPARMDGFPARPLSVGEILDRALTVFASAWASLLALCAIAYLPLAVYHYFQAVDGTRSSWVVTAGFDALQLLMTAAIAVVTARALSGGRIGVLEALACLNRRWTMVALAALAWGTVVSATNFGLEDLRQSIEPRLFTSGPTFVVAILIVRVIPFALSFLFQLVRLSAVVSLSSATLETAPLASAIFQGIALLADWSRFARVVLLCLAFSVLFSLTSLAESVVSAEMANARQAMLSAALNFLITLPVLTFVAVTGVIFFVDFRFRQGFNVPADVERQLHDAELEESEEGFA